MNYISRDKDVVFQNNDLEPLYTFKQLPVFMGCTDQPLNEDVLADMNWNISKESGMIQLNPLLPLEVVYSAEHGSGTTGKTWDEHHTEFANFINSFKPKSILEIGGLHGILAEKYLKLDSEVKWTMIEPNPTVDPTLPITVIKGFFDDKFTSDEKFEAVIHSHVLEHVYNPDEFISHKSSFMNDGDLLIFTLPNMQVMLENNYTNCINFEHTIYFTEPYIEYFLNKYNFELVEKKYFRKDHSIFYCARKTNNVEAKLPEGLYELNKSTFKKYIDLHNKDVAYLNTVINNSTSPIFLFGAHIFSQYLIAFGLDTSKVVCLLDNDTKKEGKRLYGTTLISHSPKILKDYKSATVILRAGVYNDEVKKDILNNINSNVTFI
jgi:2-polyprenyl-3-methyl-5-hydroxy-6-metoxy-1,4-benzoquinol methylase